MMEWYAFMLLPCLALLSVGMLAVSIMLTLIISFVLELMEDTRWT